MDPELLPVIVGVGEVTDRPADPAHSLEPLALMAEALRRADGDAHGGFLDRIDSLDVINQTSWSYEKTAEMLAACLSIVPARVSYGVTGGESPVRYLHQAAMRIAAGESRVAAVVGAEAQYARARARKQGISLPWTPRASTIENPVNSAALYNPIAIRHEVLAPAEIYPLYENAATAAWGQTPAEALAESGALWMRLSETAARNASAWSQKALDADAITTPTPDNRLVAWPYTKRMVANPQVNQGAAIIIASMAEARRAGVPENRLVHTIGGAFANEPRDYLARDSYSRSTAQECVLRHACAIAGEPDLLELYSCFPIVPKMALGTLGPHYNSRPSSVTGGLSFFGAPFNNYMTHAVAAMVRAIRNGDGDTGLLYGQGEFVTKHHGLILGRRPADAVRLVDAQAEADAARGEVPAISADYTGSANLETFTVLYDRDGAPRFAMVLARTEQGLRAVARVDGNDDGAIARLTALDRSPVGARGMISPGERAHWEFA